MTYQNKDLAHLQLGKATAYVNSYQPQLLQSISRQLNRSQLGIEQGQELPFLGADEWTLYELSWLNANGLPQVAIAQVQFLATSANLVESKSFKLYLNSLNQTKFASWQQVQQVLQQDLSLASAQPVKVQLFTLEQYSQLPVQQFVGKCIDNADILIEQYQYDANLLCNATTSQQVTETLYSNLLKSNCLVTNQPDWGSVQISYTGNKICAKALLRYIVAFRSHNEFHEQCVERIFCDIKQYCQPSRLTVYARYTRRGGLDINPWRSTEQKAEINRSPMVRQ